MTLTDKKKYANDVVVEGGRRAREHMAYYFNRVFHIQTGHLLCCTKNNKKYFRAIFRNRVSRANIKIKKYEINDPVRPDHEHEREAIFLITVPEKWVSGRENLMIFGSDRTDDVN